MFFRSLSTKYRLFWIRQKIYRILKEYEVTEIGYISIFITSPAFNELGLLNIKRVLVNESISQHPSEAKLNEIALQLNDLRDRVIGQSEEFGLVDSVFRGDGDTFYVARSCEVCQGEGRRNMMECLLWLPGTNSFKPIVLMRRIRDEFPYLWKVLLS